jgi:hypothetical protein
MINIHTKDYLALKDWPTSAIFDKAFDIMFWEIKGCKRQ